MYEGRMRVVRSKVHVGPAVGEVARGWFYPIRAQLRRYTCPLYGPCSRGGLCDRCREVINSAAYFLLQSVSIICAIFCKPQDSINSTLEYYSVTTEPR